MMVLGAAVELLKSGLVCWRAGGRPRPGLPWRGVLCDDGGAPRLVVAVVVTLPPPQAGRVSWRAGMAERVGLPRGTRVDVCAGREPGGGDLTAST